MSKTEGFLILNSQDAATTGGNFRDHFHFEYLFRALNCVIEFKFRNRCNFTQFSMVLRGRNCLLIFYI